jgi:hypothetical protein
MDGSVQPRVFLGVLGALTIGPLVLFDQFHILPAALAAFGATHVVFRLEDKERS